MMGKDKLYRYLFNEQTEKKTSIVVEERDVSYICPLHWHNYIELELCIDGTGYQLFNGVEYEFKKGTLAIARMTDFHQVVPTDNIKLIHIMIEDRVLSQEILNRLSTSSDMIYDLNEEEMQTMLGLFNLCRKESERDNVDLKYIKNLLECLFVQVFRIAPRREMTVYAQSIPIQRAVLFMHMHFRENPSLEKVAQIAHYSPCHFSSTFHKEMGKTYSEYLNVLKLDYAKELLMTTDLKICDVGFECGFTSHSNFLRLFKDYFSVSPLQYRNKK